LACRFILTVAFRSGAAPEQNAIVIDEKDGGARFCNWRPRASCWCWCPGSDKPWASLKITRI